MEKLDSKEIEDLSNSVEILTLEEYIKKMENDNK